MLTQKNTIILTVALALMVAVLYWTFGTAPVASAGTAEMERIIQVYGEAELSAAPDRAQIVLGVETRSETAQEAVAENARLMSDVMDALKKMGLAEEQLETGSYQLHTQREYKQPSRPGTDEYTLIYRASNRLNIKLENIKETGAVIDTAVRAGANQVQSINFELRDAESLKLQALQAATVQAGGKAKAIAGSAGISIKGIKSISEDMASYTPYRAPFMEDAMLRATGETETPVVPGDVKVQARITVEYYF